MSRVIARGWLPVAVLFSVVAGPAWAAPGSGLVFSESRGVRRLEERVVIPGEGTRTQSSITQLPSGVQILRSRGTVTLGEGKGATVLETTARTRLVGERAATVLRIKGMSEETFGFIRAQWNESLQGAFPLERLGNGTVTWRLQHAGLTRKEVVAPGWLARTLGRLLSLDNCHQALSLSPGWEANYFTNSLTTALKSAALHQPQGNRVKARVLFAAERQAERAYEKRVVQGERETRQWARAHGISYREVTLGDLAYVVAWGSGVVASVSMLLRALASGL